MWVGSNKPEIAAALIAKQRNYTDIWRISVNTDIQRICVNTDIQRICVNTDIQTCEYRYIQRICVNTDI